MNKVMSLHDATAKYVGSGDAICFGGFTANRKPYAAIFKILRQGQTGFTVQTGPTGGDWDVMIGEDRVKAHTNCYTTSSDYTNVSRRFHAAIEADTLTYEDYSQGVLILQLHAASLSLPYLPMRLMQGSGLTDFWGTSEGKRQTLDKLIDLKFAYVKNPFSPDEKVVAVPTPQLDTATIHVQRTSPGGTCVIEGNGFHDVNVTVAARRIIMTCEELVSDEYIRQGPSQNKIFGECVNAIVHVLFGTWPSQCYNYYDCDDKALKEHDKASKYQDREDAERQIAKEKGEAEKKGLPYTAPINLETFHDYLDKWVYNYKDNNDVLDKTGGAHLVSLKVIPGFGYTK